MFISEIIKESLRSLSHNKMRTFLSALGIIIGIASVIGLLSIGEGTRTQISNQIASVGSNNIQLMSMGGGNRDQQAIKSADVVFLRQEIFAPYISNVSAQLSSSDAVSYRDKSIRTSVTGVDAQFFEIRSTIKVASGRQLDEDDFNNYTKNAIIGNGLVEDLFDSNNPLGQQFKFADQYWTVVGILEESGGMMQSDTVVYIPVGSMATYVPGMSLDELSQVLVSVPNIEQVNQVENLLKYIFMQRRRLTDPDELNLTVISAKDMMEMVDSVMSMITGLLAGIAAISLLVGGIGIMNIMLVTVTERTREIGLRKALGAHRSTIILQFLAESVLLCLIGGAVGFIVGSGFAAIGTKLMDIDFHLSGSSVVLSITVATVIGLLFGIYPANKAAKLQPIEALRYD